MMKSRAPVGKGSQPRMRAMPRRSPQAQSKKDHLSDERVHGWVTSAMINFRSLGRVLPILGLLAAICTGCSGVRVGMVYSPLIYDPRADGEEQLRAALAVARKEQKRVLLDLGANWCSDSHATY